MSKQDITNARTPTDLERKYLLNFGKTFAEVEGIALDARKTAENLEAEVEKQNESIGLLVDNGKVKGSVIIEAINDESTAKISADKIDVEGAELNIKVDATNITGKVTAEQMNADGIVAEDVDIKGKVNAEEGSIGGWTIGENLTATSETRGLGIIQRQTVTFSAGGVEAAGVYLEDPAWTGPQSAFPPGIIVGQTYGPVFKTWAELLGVYDTATIEVVSDE